MDYTCIIQIVQFSFALCAFVDTLTNLHVFHTEHRPI